MVVGINVTQDDVETLFVEVQLTGLTAGTRYDVMRLQLRYLGDDDTGNPIYERELPDRRALWSSVAHRVGWVAPAATATFRDYECPMRPTVWFVVATAQVGPAEWDWAGGDYPVSRGVLGAQVVHFDRELEQAMEAGPHEKGHVLVRSTSELGLYVTSCVVDIPEMKYTARGTELAVLGRQYPVYIADTREARRGSLTLLTRDLGQYDDLRRIVFPADGRIRPVIFNSGSDATMLLDDLRVVPLDVSIEQVTQTTADFRYIHIDFVEVDPTTPLVHRTGDNDDLVNKPVANFTISDTTPARNQWVTLADTSTGQFDSWEWTIGHSNNQVGKFYTKGPHKVRWTRRGRFTIKLRVYGSITGTGGAHTRSKTVTVH